VYFEQNAFRLCYRQHPARSCYLPNIHCHSRAWYVPVDRQVWYPCLYARRKTLTEHSELGILSSDLAKRNPSPNSHLSFSGGVNDGGSSRAKTRRESTAIIERMEKREPEPAPKLSFSEGVNDGGSSKRSPDPEPKLSFSEGVNDGGSSKRSPQPAPKLSFSKGVNDGGSS